ncbi:helix-turn-helix transcriptional regulator [Halocatena salina]|uniref:MarR family transcriptional regulator n=1 Tax=Halocatena salina TaxID=2934340 RepID=A0A8U0A5U4_9EURY|nr:MarR family transcriptional regulator [Halocatena salina]UPM44560.1 MarR family transcriptional regulator [Halocatena salina]
MTDLDQFIDFIRYSPLIETLQGEALERKELEQRLEISRATSHRYTNALGESGLIEKSDGAFTLTELGEMITETVVEFKQETRTALILAPALEALPPTAPAIDIAAFTDATVTTAGPGNPYRGVNRFMSLVDETSTLRGLDPTSINPQHIDELHAQICDGMETQVVFPPAIAEKLLVSNPERAQTIFESGNLTFWIHDDLPFGLTLCDDRIGIGIYDDETGMLKTYVDTDAAAAYDWAESLYEFYRSDADPLDWDDKESETLSL